MYSFIFPCERKQQRNMEGMSLRIEIIGRRRYGEMEMKLMVKWKIYFFFP